MVAESGGKKCRIDKSVRTNEGRLAFVALMAEYWVARALLAVLGTAELIGLACQAARQLDPIERGAGVGHTSAD